MAMFSGQLCPPCRKPTATSVAITANMWLTRYAARVHGWSGEEVGLTLAGCMSQVVDAVAKVVRACQVPKAVPDKHDRGVRGHARVGMYIARAPRPPD